MSIVINGSGTITGITAGGLPDATITQAELATGVAGTGPAFSAYQSSAQSVSNASFTKVQLQTEEFDTNGNFDNTTNYRFTPTVAGYYQINGSINFGTASGITLSIIYKNGVRFKDGQSFQNSAVGNSSTVSALVYLNGSTDYIELYAYQTSGSSQNSGASQNATYFQGSLVRAA